MRSDEAHGDVGRFVPPPSKFDYLDRHVRFPSVADMGRRGMWLPALAIGLIIAAAAFAYLVCLAGLKFMHPAPPRPVERLIYVRDDGRYANDPLKSWFDSLASGRGACCSFADGVSIQDVDWDTACDAGTCRYRVRLQGQWVDVPPNAVVTEPNRFGPAVVWPYMDSSGTTQIRCFLPGAGA